MRTYNDDYPTCVETYATLRCYHAEAAPEAVTEALGIQPSSSHVKGTQLMDGRQVCRPISGWLLRSKGAVESRDVKRHIDWLLDQVCSLESRLTALKDQGWRMDINCYWLSGGQGGPMLDPSQMAELARLNLTCGFDVYWVAESEESGSVKSIPRLRLRNKV